MKLMTLCALTLAFAFNAQADLLTLTKSGAKSARGNVDLSSGATANIAGKNVTLTTVGNGIRQMNFFVMVDIYVGQMLVSDASRYVKTDSGALPSMQNQNTIAMRFDFMRTLTAKQLAKGFQESLTANKVPTNDPDTTKLMQLVNSSGGTSVGAYLNLVINKNADGTETLIYELKNGANSTGGTVVGARGLMTKIVSCWLGVPSDDEMVTLKAELLR